MSGESKGVVPFVVCCGLYCWFLGVFEVSGTSHCPKMSLGVEALRLPVNSWEDSDLLWTSS